MNTIINKAERKAISALMKEIKRRNGYHSLENPRAKRLLKLWFVKEFWRRVHELTVKEATGDVIPVDLRSLASSFTTLCKGGCVVKETPAWIEIRLTNHSYWISGSEGKLYITAGHMDTFLIGMNTKRLVSMVESFDAFLGKDDVEIEQVFEKALIEYHAQKKCEEILTMTVQALIQDLIDDEKISFEVKQQKNGRLCITINRRASWLPNKVFRTTFETLREDFAKAYDEFKKERYRVYCQ
jgi:hypothetical protein